MRKKRLMSYEAYERKERFKEGFKDGLMDGFMILLCVAPAVVIITTIIKIVLWFRENLAFGSDVWSVFQVR